MSKKNSNKADNTQKSRTSMEDGLWRKGKALAPYWHANDGTWYTMGATLSPNILNWNTKLTSPTSWDLDGTGLNVSTLQIRQTVTPGIMVLRFLPTVGKCDEFNDAMNVAARGLHTYIWHKATRTTQYDAADLMLYCGLADSLNAFYGLMCRLYGLLPTYGYNNAFYPEAAIYAQGFDPDDLRKHMPEFRTYINMYARKIGRFAVPASLPIFKRHNYLCSNVFKDDDDPDMYQTYIPMPDGFYKFGLDGNGWGMMEYVPLSTMGTGAWTFDQLVAYGDVLINSWAFNTDLDSMSADVLQAMGPENCWGVSTIDEDYRSDPIFDGDFLTQVENMDFLGNRLSETGFYNVTQDASGVIHQRLPFANAELRPLYSELVLGAQLYARKRIIANKPTTSLEEVMEVTRGVSFPYVNGGADDYVILQPTYASTEVWMTMKIVVDATAGGNTFWHTFQGTGFLFLDVNSSGSTAVGRRDHLWWYTIQNSFKHHPATRLILGNTGSSSTAVAVMPDNRDLRHYAELTGDQLRQINEQAVFSEWNVAKSNFVQS